MNGVEMSQADQMSGQLSGLDQFRQKFARMLIHFIWVNVFLVMGTAWWVLGHLFLYGVLHSRPLCFSFLSTGVVGPTSRLDRRRGSAGHVFAR